MARFELNIYGADDEIVKEYKANICPWGVYIQAASLQDSMKDAEAKDQMKAIGEILKCVFVGLNDDELAHADGRDVINTFMQIVTSGQQIQGKETKNASRVSG